MDRARAEQLRDRWSEVLQAATAAEESAAPAEEAFPPFGKVVGRTRLATGIVGDEQGWSLAVRVQSEGPDLEEIITAMRADADGEIDIRRIGRVVALQATPKDKSRPVITGISCSHLQGAPGTIGCFVRNENDPQSPHFVLSNNHVIGLSNLAAQDDKILQPALGDFFDVTNVIARFERSVKLEAKHNLVDAAIARVEVPALLRQVFGRALPIAGIRTTPLVTNERVTKVGRTTGEREGTIFALGVKDLEVDFNGTPRSFDEQIEIAPSGDDFCDEGDSGALILDASSLVVGLLFGKSNKADRLAYANPIGEVFRKLHIELA